ncbi:MAG: sensor domain-containing diguanylate cyclase [Longicatena sp.]
MNKTSLANRFCEELLQKDWDSTKIIELLTLLCNEHSFEHGMIYEISQFNIFHLKEHTKDDTHIPKESYALHELQKYYLESYQQDALCLWHSDSKMSEIFGCATLLIYPILDMNKQVLGFIACSTGEEDIELDASSLASLKMEITLFSQFVKDRMYENKVSFAITSLEDILDNTGIDIYVNDFNNHDILYVNKSMAAPYGGAKEFMNRKCWEVLFPGQKGQCEFCPQKNLIDEDGNPTKVYTWDYQRAFDGSWFRVFSSAFHWIDGRMAHVVSSADITDNKKYEALIHHMANYDELTNLPNRRMLIEECARRIKQATPDEKGYVLFFDIDGFKSINDNYGHDAGDEFLVLLGKFLLEIPLLKDNIYRNGGDEFVAVLGGENFTHEHIKNLCNSILHRFQMPWKLSKGEVYCSTSIGIACYPEDGNDPEELICVADQAMYKVKKSGGAGIQFHEDIKKQ